MSSAILNAQWKHLWARSVSARESEREIASANRSTFSASASGKSSRTFRTKHSSIGDGLRIVAMANCNPVTKARSGDFHGTPLHAGRVTEQPADSPGPDCGCDSPSCCRSRRRAASGIPRPRDVVGRELTGTSLGRVDRLLRLGPGGERDRCRTRRNSGRLREAPSST